MTALEPKRRIIYAVGISVLTSQEIERHLKFLIPFVSSDNPALDSIVAVHAKLAKKSLGEVAGQFADAGSGDVEAFKSYVKQIVGERNEIVHHFQDRFGGLLAEAKYQEVLGALHSHHQRALQLLHVLREFALVIAETMRDSIFASTPEYAEIAKLCEGARASLTK